MIKGHSLTSQHQRDEELAQENARLYQEIQRKRASNMVTGKFLKLCSVLLDRCVQLLRQFAYEKTAAILRVHAKYSKRIEDKRAEYDALVLRGAELEQQVFAISRALAKLVRIVSQDIKVETSLDYHYAKKLAQHADT